MGTNLTTRGGHYYWQKFLVILIVGVALMIAGIRINNGYLQWGSVVILLFSGWYAILSLFAAFDRMKD